MQNGLSAGCWVLPIEIPRAGVVGHGGLKVGHALIEDFHFALCRWWGQEGGNAVRNRGLVEGVVDLADVVDWCIGITGQLLAASDFNFFQDFRLAMFFKQGDRRPERDKPAELAHVDAVAVGISNLGSAGDEEDAGGLEAIKNGHNGLAQGGATND